jgi:putative heme-binding domain-containing protein
LSAVHAGNGWGERDVAEALLLPDGFAYLYVRVVSGRRQSALLTLDDRHGVTEIWQDETALDDRIADGTTARWIVDLQPGSNDFLIRASTGAAFTPRLQAATKVEISLPEKLDSSMLAERLRSASVGGAGQPVPSEFAEIDWSKPTGGDAAEGRKLFGTLGCAKCHAVAPDQKSAGAPSLFEAKRRFAVPHVVESVLLPSRQVAEPFRAQTFVTDDGRMLTALVTGESENFVDLLLPDATRKSLAKKQIEERSPTALSPMPQGLVKTPDELRHLLAYLLSDRPLPP